MKQFSLFIFLFFNSFFSFAQEFTPPDSAAIIKNQVKSIKIYYTGGGGEHLITQEYRYDKAGQCIFSREGKAPYYYAYAYYDNGRLRHTIKRSNLGKMLSGSLYAYYPDGVVEEILVFNGSDTLHPSVIYHNDRSGNKICEDHYTGETLTRSYKYKYDANNKLVHRIDSTPGKSVYETQNSKVIRQTYYNANNVVVENCLIYYSDKERLSQTVCTVGEKNNIYTVVYDNYGDGYQVLMNGKPVDKEEYVKWDSKFRWLMPRQAEEEDDDAEEENLLPYLDMKNSYEYKHTLTRDKKNNIKKDTISCKHRATKCPTVHFDYEYESW
jgi:hypothetical protein